MGVDSSIIMVQLELSETSFNEFGTGTYRPVDERLHHVVVGHEDGYDHLAFRFEAESHDWLESTNALEIAIFSIADLSDDWLAGAVVVRYPSHLREKMGEFVVDLIERVGAEDVLEAIDSVIREWSTIWRRAAGPLSREAQQGLFGELIVLDRLIANTGTAAVEGWDGPRGGIHDFVYPSRLIEVKTTGHSEPVLNISSFNQLRPTSPGLTLVMVQVRGGGGLSLPDLVDLHRGQLENHREHSEVFEELLEMIGYFDRHSSNYGTSYQDVKISSFQINENSDVLHEDRLDRPILGLIEARWSLDPSTLFFEEVSQDFWSM